MKTNNQTEANKKNIQNLVRLGKCLKNVESDPTRSCWAKGVQSYAIDLIGEAIEYVKYDISEGLEPANIDSESFYLNGATNWREYSYGCCALCYDSDIAKYLCTPSELKRLTYKDGGMKNQNSRENWLDVQARALFQAYQMIKRNMPAE